MIPFGSYSVEEIYVNGRFAGHRGVMALNDLDKKIYFLNPIRIIDQWTPLATRYQLGAVNGFHPLDDNGYGIHMVREGREYDLHLVRLTRLFDDKLLRTPFHIDSLDYKVKLLNHESSPLDNFRVTFDILLPWTITEEIGPVVINSAAIARVNLTP